MPSTGASGKYELIRQLATGGMGEIFLARQKGPAGFDRKVVLKRILKHLAADPSFVEQFLNEGRLIARISHPNVVQILELGHGDDGGWFLALEYIHGVTLREVRHRLHAVQRELPMRLAAWVLAQALHGLHAAHELRDEGGKPLGLVHRDVSPDNLMLGYSGAVKLLDFGVAKATSAGSTTRPGTLKGKIPYLAPEVISKDLTTPAADLYAMGVVLYELAVGKRPFEAENEAALLQRVLHEPPVPVRVLAPHVDVELAGIAERALQKDPAARFASARAMAEALERYAAAGGEPQSAATLSAFMHGLFGDVPEPVVSAEPAQGTVTLERPDVVAVAPVARRSLVVPLLALGGVVLMGGGAWWVLRPVAAPKPVAQPVMVEEFPVPAPAPLVVEPVAEVVVDAGVEEPAVAPALRKRSGRVLVQVQPWAEVYEGGKKLGVTPMPALVLSAGSHVLVLRNPQLKVEKKVTVRVAAGSSQTLRVSLQ
ncbi:MAG: serine/threonine protein kinase [Myxococcaceae bacterium]|nr:serine/threonine protein kinase [Myxococcaceae bacterium]